ncbi:hypothetical protein FHG66_11025, partial [Rubellimicrobium rubrum]
MRLTLKLKLAGVFTIMMGLSTGSTLLGISDLSLLNQRLNDVVANEAEMVHLAQALTLQVSEIQTEVREYMISDGLKERIDIRAQINEMRKMHDDVEVALKQIAPAASLELLDRYDQLLGSIRQINNEAMTLVDGYQEEDARRLVMEDGSQVWAEMKDTLSQVLEQSRHDMTVASQDTSALYVWSRTLLVTAMVIGAVVGIAGATWIILTISRGLNQAIGLASRVEAGDLTQT